MEIKKPTTQSTALIETPEPTVTADLTTTASAQSSPPPKDQGTIRKNRIFILDTNILIHDAMAFATFRGVVVGIPFVVLEELDGFKSDSGERGRNAREAIRTIDSMRSKGRLNEGVLINEDSIGTPSLLKVYPTPTKLDMSHLPDTACSIKDNMIIQTVQNLVNEGNQVTLVTKDINARVKADALGLDAEDYTKGKISYESFYKGWHQLELPTDQIRLLTNNTLINHFKEKPLMLNEFVVAQSPDAPAHYRLFRYLGQGSFKEVQNITLMHSFEAKNVQQLMALDLLLDDSIQLVTLLGPAGTGKTFLALLVGLYKVAYQRTYQRLMVTRPIVALGADVGFLPGELSEKLHYWMQPIHDNIEFIYSQLMRGSLEQYGLGQDRGNKDRHKDKEKNRHHDGDQHRRDRGSDRGGHRDGRGDEQNNAQWRLLETGHTHPVERLTQRGILSLEAITYMRGRSIPFQFVFIDEVQNLTPHEVKTIVSRAGQGTKVILAGDPYQIDSPYLDFTSNGLTVTTEKFKNNPLFGTAFLEISERSELAKLAATLL